MLLLLSGSSTRGLYQYISLKLVIITRLTTVDEEVEVINYLDLWEYLSTKSIISLLCELELSRKSKSKS